MGNAMTTSTEVDKVSLTARLASAQAEIKEALEYVSAMNTSRQPVGDELNLNRLARFKGASRWNEFGSVGFIDAARMLMEKFNQASAAVEVRCMTEPDAIYTFNMVRKTEFVCTNPRLGAE